MSRILEEPPVDPVRSYFSQQCVLLTGIAAGVVDHSSFRASPLTAARRLKETVRAMLGLTFGELGDALAIDRVGVHGGHG